MNYKQKYYSHKFGAKRRGIEFMFTYDEWIAWWGDDIDNRGNAPDNLCMSRYGDVGPYHPDNVFKNTISKNSSEGNNKICLTPAGVFYSTKDAAAANNITQSTLKTRCSNRYNFHDFQYLEKEQLTNNKEKN